jgi:glutathione S-transferase
MKLLYQTHSPFARKALVFALEAGLGDQVTVEHHETSPTRANAVVFAENPLGKVPVLLRQDQEPIFDSAVICAYLDTLHARPKLIPAKGEARWRALRLEAVAQGLADSGIQIRWERVRRPEKLRYQPLADGYTLKLNESYAWLENQVYSGEPINVGHIALATALDWLEFRELPSFRAFSRLSAWFDAFAQRPSMRATPLAGETQD